MNVTIIYDSHVEDDETCQSNLLRLIDTSNYNFLDINHTNFFSSLKADKNFIINLVDDGLAFIIGEISLPSIFELFDKKYFGSTPSTILCASNKVTYKHLIEEDSILKIPKYKIIKKEDAFTEEINFYPVILKPIYTTASIGITRDNIVHNAQELSRFIQSSILKIFIAEEYIVGNECTISSIGNGENTHVLPVMWYVCDRKDKVLTYDAKWRKGSEDYNNYQKMITQPDEIHNTLMKKMNQSLKIRDYSKADFIEKDGRYYLIDVSPNPTLTKSSAFTEQFLFNSKKLEDLIPDLLKGTNI